MDGESVLDKPGTTFLKLVYTVVTLWLTMELADLSRQARELSILSASPFPSVLVDGIPSLVPAFCLPLALYFWKGFSELRETALGISGGFAIYEIMQYLMPESVFDPLDLLMILVGVTLFLVLQALLRWASLIFPLKFSDLQEAANNFLHKNPVSG